MKKIFFMQGGLGNQICILSKIYEEYYKGSKVIIDLSSYEINPHRKFILEDYFDLLDIKIQKGNFIKFIIFRLINKIMELYNKSSIDLFFLKTTFYCDYFQNDIDTRIEKLKKHFKVNINNNKSVLCLHLRRGDYTQSKFRKFHGIVEFRDILSAIFVNKEFIKSNFSKISLVTEDKDFDYPSKLIGIPVDIFKGSDHEAFLHLISSGGIIASNSTFSLTAGLLKEKKLFLIPSQWFMKKNSDFLGKSFKKYKCTLS